MTAFVLRLAGLDGLLVLPLLRSFRVGQVVRGGAGALALALLERPAESRHEVLVAHRRAGRLGAAEGGADIGLARRFLLGENRRLLVFALDELPQMARGRGVIVQRYRQGGLLDLVVFDAAAGLSWDSGGRTRREIMTEWEAPRGTSGRAPPHGFPKDGKFA